YNVYRDGEKLNETPLAVSNYTDPSGILSSSYTVAALVGGVEQEQSQAIRPWSKQYLEINMVNRPDAYTINDATTADLDGDGEYEIIVKRLNTQYEVTDTLYTYFEAYKQDGTFMWEINVGPNILSSSGVEINIAAFDFDEDGKAEVFLRSSEGTIFADGTKIGDVDGDGKTNYRYSVLQSPNMQYMNEGPEFLSLVDGETGIELDRVDFIPRGKSTDWGDGYGHRANKFFFGAPYLDGKKPSLFIGRGIYTKTVMRTYDVVNKKLVFRWQFTTLENPSYAYQGNHNYTIADVDEDGRDEIVWGGMCVDDDGKGLYSTGFGHGDALHVGDFDPFRKGTEVWRCLENSPAWGTALCDGATGAILIHEISGRDCGRCCAANISDDIKGAALWGSQTLFSASTKKAVTASGLSVNFRIYWDGDLLEELLDHNWNGDQSEGRIHKPNGGNLLVAAGTSSCNWTKGTPSLQADLFGDWREEVIWRTTDNSKIRIYTTIDPTPYRNYTLMHDHQYRQAICWQMCGYNQPPHVSYFLGEGEGMTVPPPPSATNGRLVYQGSSDWDKTTTAWKKDNDKRVYTDGEHVHFDVLNGLDVKLNLIDTVSPANMTVNSPGDYTINASSGLLSGTMGLMKQGLGTLYLDGHHDFSGNTEIWNGRLDFSGSLMKSHIWVNLFGELSVAGALNKGVSMRYGSSLFVGTENSFGNLLIKDSLVVEEQSKLVFDVQSLPFAKNDTLTIDGNLILQDGVSFCIVPHLKNDENRLAVGEYLLAQFTGDIIAISDQLPITGILGTAAELKIENNSIILVVKAMREAASVVWSGSLSNVWDLATSANFLYQGAEDVFVTNDSLLFNDESVVSEVAIAEVVAPSSVMVDKALDFKFSGAGAISGEASLTKKGSGVFTISNHNTFTGKVSIEEGTVQVSALPNLISEESPIGPVSYNANLLVINGGTLQVSEEAIMDRAMRIGANGATLNNSKKVSWNSVMVGDTLFKTGAGELVFDGANTNKNLTIKEGVVRLLDEDAQPAKSVTFEGGVLRCYDNSGSYSSANYSLYVPEGKTGTIYLDSRCSYNNVLTGKGELTVSFPWIRSDLNGNWSNFEGKINIIGSQCRINNGYGYAKAAVNMGKDVYAEHLSQSMVKIG
ncbi:MAG: autotransporter-associated beta strand repeat-containing protein, partial [Bacteroidales bacterium]|nr:autotransporter-associated beta strand repeat-containing protein [Bacteroidales bacterium]